MCDMASSISTSAGPLPPGGCPLGHTSAKGSTPDAPKATPKSNDTINPRNQMQIEERQTPTVGQRKPLPTERVVSSIPKGDFNPVHQHEEKQRWEYPSQQMFFNAMKRKGWDPKEHDMGAVVSIHNMVNETAWRQVLLWEQLHPDTANDVQLVKFEGKAKDFSPKARLKSLLGQDKPFDRHDWVVQRGDEQFRYVIDFYNVHAPNGDPVAVHIDARPALDSPSQVFDRLRMGFNRLFGLAEHSVRSAVVPTGAAQLPDRRHEDPSALQAVQAGASSSGCPVAHDRR